MDDSKRKSKEPAETSTTTTTHQHTSDDRHRTPTASPHHPSPSSTAPSSSSHPEIESESINLTTPNAEDAPQTTANQESPSPSSPRIQLSSIPRASSRPFFNRQTSGSQRPPRPQESQSSIMTTAVAAATSSTGSVFSNEQNLAAKLRLMKPAERADFRSTGQLGKKINRKKRKRAGNQSEAGRTRLPRIRLGSSPLGSDLTPYQKVQQCLAQLKDFINFIAGSDTSSASPRPLPNPSAAHATSSSSSGRPIAPATTDGDSDDDGEWTVEEVIGILEEFLTMIPTTIGAQEMENGLLEIQTRLGVDPRPTWYALMCKSHEHMWVCLTDNFDCDALDKS